MSTFVIGVKATDPVTFTNLLFTRSFKDGRTCVKAEFTSDGLYLVISDELLNPISSIYGALVASKFDGETLVIGPWSLVYESNRYYPGGKVFRRVSLEPKVWEFGAQGGTE